MKIKYILYTVALLFYACSSDDIQPENCSETPGPPVFITDPVAINDTENLTFQVQTNVASNIYFIISGVPLDDKSPVNIKAKAQSGTDYINTGSFQIPCNKVDSVNSIQISGLPPDKKLYAYLIAESFDDQMLQEHATEFTFSTEERLAVKTFYSSIKGRNSLYVRYLPTKNMPTNGPNNLHPLIVFLGGNSEVAPEGQITVIQNGSIPEYVSKGNHIPFIVIAPEHNTSYWDPNFVHEVIQHTIKNYPVDTDRIIVTGLSGGANGTLNYAFKYPDVPAAIVPISGWADNLEQACDLVNMAVWIFHNQKDPKVSTEHSIRLRDALRACNQEPKEVNLTIFSDAGHIAWVRVYDPKSEDWNLDPLAEPIDIYDWMYKQSK